LKSIAALLLAVCPLCWTWDRVLTSCTGGPETISHYYFQATVRLTVPATCVDDLGQEYDCSYTIPGEPLRFGPDIPDPGEGASVSASFDPVAEPDLLPNPPVGAFHAWPWPSPECDPVVAVDAAGNDSGGCP